jgi:hypothetical protein
MKVNLLMNRDILDMVSTSFKGIIEDGHIVRAWVVQRETTEQKLQEKEREKLLKRN